MTADSNESVRAPVEDSKRLDHVEVEKMTTLVASPPDVDIDPVPAARILPLKTRLKVTAREVGENMAISGRDCFLAT